MRSSTIVLGAVLFCVCIVAIFSFIVLKKINIDLSNNQRVNKAALIYDHFTKIAAAQDLDRAEKIVSEIIQKYPDREQAPEALREIADLFYQQGKDQKAAYYYKQFINKYPVDKTIPSIKEKLKKISARSFQSEKFSQDVIEYTIQPGDSLFSIAKKFNTTVNYLQQLNGLKSDLIRAGQKLKVAVAEFSIYVDKNENILILNKNGEPFKTYSVATGKNNSTPEGEFKIVDKMIEPAWTRPDGKIVYPGDPEYELGARWMPISEPGYGIHGTNDDSSIGKQATMGCVRMHNTDVIELYNIIPRGTKVEIVDTSRQKNNDSERNVDDPDMVNG